MRKTGPWWQHGAVRFNILDNLLGPNLYERTPVPGKTITRMLRLPEENYVLRLTLVRVTRHRAGSRRPPRLQPFIVEWKVLDGGIPVKAYHRGPGVTGSSVEVPKQAVIAGTWAAAALAEIGVQVTRWRTSNRYDPGRDLDLTAVPG